MTLTLDDDLYKKAQHAATMQGKTVDEFVNSVLRLALSNNEPEQAERNGLRVLVVGDTVPRIDPRRIRLFTEENDSAVFGQRIRHRLAKMTLRC